MSAIAMPEPIKPAIQFHTGAELEKMSNERLGRELSRIGELTVQVLEYGARVWKVLKDRGEDMSKYTDAVFTRIRQIAAATLSPQVPIVFGIQSALTSRLSRLPLEDQERLSAEGATVPLAVHVKDHGWTHTNMPVRNLCRDHLAIVFDGDTVRTFEQQVACLTEPLPEVEAPSCRCYADRTKDTLYYGDVEIPLGVVCDALRRAKLKL